MGTHVILLSSFVIVSCAAHVDSDLKLNGAPYQPTSCISGQTRGFSGIELQDKQGSRLRLATNIDGSVSVAYFSPGRVIGENLGTCGTLSIEPGIAVINGARNLNGAARLSCQAADHRIEGTIRFENCH